MPASGLAGWVEGMVEFDSQTCREVPRLAPDNQSHQPQASATSASRMRSNREDKGPTPKTEGGGLRTPPLPEDSATPSVVPGWVLVWDLCYPSPRDMSAE